MVLLVDVIGTIGALLILIAFVTSSLDKISRRDFRYIGINGIGALLLVYYAYMTGAWVFVGLNIIWLGVEVYYLIRKLFKS